MKEGEATPRTVTGMDGRSNGFSATLKSAGSARDVGNARTLTPPWTIVLAGMPDQTEIRGMGGAASADPFGARGDG